MAKIQFDGEFGTTVHMYLKDPNNNDMHCIEVLYTDANIGRLLHAMKHQETVTVVPPGESMFKAQFVSDFMFEDDMVKLFLQRVQ